MLCQCGCGEKSGGRSGFALYHFLMFNKQDKRSFAVKKWLLLQGFKEYEITEDFFKEKRREYYSGDNSPWGRAKNKGEEHFDQARQTWLKSMDRSKWNGYVNPFSKQYFIDQGHTEEEATRNVKKRNRWCKEYWLDLGFDLETSSLYALKNNPGSYQYINYDGLSTDEIRDIIDRMNPQRRRYWIVRGYSEEEAEYEFRIRNSMCDEFWIARGKSNEWIDAWRKNNIIKSLETSKNNRSSMQADDFIIKIVGLYGLDCFEVVSQITTGYEYRIGNYFYDFTDLDNRLVIEYNGDMFHANPRYFNEQDCPNPFKKEMTAKEIWEYDNTKIKRAIDNGFHVIVVWTGAEEVGIESIGNFYEDQKNQKD